MALAPAPNIYAKGSIYEIDPKKTAWHYGFRLNNDSFSFVHSWLLKQQKYQYRQRAIQQNYLRQRAHRRYFAPAYVSS